MSRKGARLAPMLAVRRAISLPREQAPVLESHLGAVRDGDAEGVHATEIAAATKVWNAHEVIRELKKGQDLLGACGRTSRLATARTGLACRRSARRVVNAVASTATDQRA